MNKEILSAMIEGTFPTGIHLAIGYGSGVFEQKGYHVAESIDDRT